MEIDPAFLEQRAVSLATVLLTRHPKLMVVVAQPNLGYDLNVWITSGQGGPTARMFAVELKARKTLAQIGTTMPSSEEVRLKDPLRRGLTAFGERMKDLPFPLMYIVFAMDTDAAYFGWLREPVADTKSLATPEVRIAQVWSAQTHVRIVDKVNAWYSNRTPL